MKKQPLERLGKPEEIAKTVRFLASENADFITGQVVNQLRRYGDMIKRDYPR